MYKKSLKPSERESQNSVSHNLIAMKRQRTGSFGNYDVVTQSTQPLSQGWEPSYPKRQFKSWKGKYFSGYKYPQPPRNIRTEIKRAINQMAEKKRTAYTWSLTPQCLQNATGSLTNNYVVLNPSNSGNGYSISTGATQGDMIGNKIRCRKAILTMTITQTPYNVTTNTNPQPLLIRFWFFKSKATPTTAITTAQLTANATGNFFESTSGNDQNLQGTALDMMLRMNNDAWTYLGHKDCKLGPQAPQGLGSTATDYYSNNDFAFHVKVNMDVTRMLPVTQTKQDNNTWAEPWVYCLMQVIAADQTYGPIATSQQIMNWRGVINYYYTDV